MIRLRIEESDGSVREEEFLGQTVTIGRGPENQLVLDNPSVSKNHGRITYHLGHHLYVDLGSSNGTIVLQSGQALAVTGKQVRGQSIEPGAVLRIGPFRVRLENESGIFSDPNSGEYEIEESIRMLPDQGGRSYLPSPRISEQFIEFVQEVRATMDDRERQLRVFRDFVFRVFPQSTHLFLLIRDPQYGNMQPVLRTSKRNLHSDSTVSRTLVHRVIEEESALLCGRGQADLGIQSMANIGIESALCAPLRGATGTYGVLQVDIRGFSRDSFTINDLELLALVADFVGMAFEGRRVSGEERRRFRTALDALLVALETHEPERVFSTKRRAHWIKILGRRLRLHDSETRIIRYAALLAAFDPRVVETLSYPPSLSVLPEILRAREPEIENPENHQVAIDIMKVAEVIDQLAIRPLTNDDECISAEDERRILDKLDGQLASHVHCLARAFHQQNEDDAAA